MEIRCPTFVVPTGKNGSRCDYGQKALVTKNFKRHFICNHPDVAINMGLAEEHIGEPFTKKSKITKIVVETNRVNVIQGTLTLDTSNKRVGFPDWEGMILLVGPLWKVAKLVMSREKLADMVRRSAAIVKDLMMSEIRGKIIHAKIDSETRRGRTFFGINLQFANEQGCIVVRHLGMLTRHLYLYI
ncbi:uncharacterized protein LOC134219386 [Armigeres subalbatus]|uniref:uncharacterized protein LOC134219386 n=1 Tax=Armigeres subalbatus TaxID=124917 RepID=UPI002ED2F7F6